LKFSNPPDSGLLDHPNKSGDDEGNDFLGTLQVVMFGLDPSIHFVLDRLLWTLGIFYLSPVGCPRVTANTLHGQSTRQADLFASRRQAGYGLTPAGLFVCLTPAGWF